jgi:hypothetical protein
VSVLAAQQRVESSIKLPRGARRRRGVATIAVVGALVVGTFWGDDDNWPFGPFRMYSVRNELDGRVRVPRIELLLANGNHLDTKIEPNTFALRVAEVEGQVEKLENDPSLLRHFEFTYAELNPGTAIVGVRLYYEITQLDNGRPIGSTTQTTIATWGDS